MNNILKLQTKQQSTIIKKNDVVKSAKNWSNVRI